MGRTPRYDVEERIEKAEEMLCAGVSPGRIERTLSKEYGITERQVRKYIAKVYERWLTQTAIDAPHRREKIIRMAERFYARALGEKQFTAAAGALGLMAKMSGAFAQHDPEREARIAELGPPPTDPTMALVYAQRCMLFALSEVVSNPAIDPERRLRWIAEIGSKIGMTHAKTLVQAKLDEVATRVLGPGDRHADEMDVVDGIDWPATSRAGSGDAGHVPAGGPGAGAAAPEHEGGAPGGRRPVGPD